MKYTPELTKQLIEGYRSGKNMVDLCGELDLPPRSAIAKLSSLGVYQKKGYVNKNGQVPVKKEQLIDRLVVLLEMTHEELESLTKCNKRVLERIIDCLDPKNSEIEASSQKAL